VASALIVVGLAWATLILSAPVLMASGRLPWLALAVYQIGALVCHQRPDRSFHFAGIQAPVCARCLGLYLAGAVGLLLAWSIPRYWQPGVVRTTLAVAALPIAMTVGLEWVGAADTSNLARLLTGLPLGAAAGWILVGGLIAHQHGARAVSSTTPPATAE
jgi:uncharacterized membrane protein